MFKRAVFIGTLLLAGLAHGGYYRGATVGPHGHSSNTDGGLIGDLELGSLTISEETEGQAAFFGPDGLVSGVDDLLYDVDSGSFTVGNFSTETVVVVSTAGDVVSGETLTFSATTSGSNRALVVTVGAFFYPVDSVTYNGVSMTLATSTLDASTNYYSDIWYLAAPDTGTHDVVVYVPSTFLINAHAVSLTGVSQTSPLLGTAVESGTAASNSIAVSSTTGGITIDAVAGPGTLTPATVGAGQTLVGSADLWVLSTSYKSVATAMSWTFAASDTFGHAAASFSPASTSQETVITPDTIIVDTLRVGTIEGGVSFASSSYVLASTFSATSIAHNTPTTMAWGSETTDTLGEFNSSTFTALYAGTYNVKATSCYAANATGYRTVDIYVNGASAQELRHSEGNPSATNVTCVPASGYLQLSAGDTVTVKTSQTSGGALNTSPGTIDQMSLKITRVR